MLENLAVMVASIIIGVSMYTFMSNRKKRKSKIFSKTIIMDSAIVTHYNDDEVFAHKHIEGKKLNNPILLNRNDPRRPYTLETAKGVTFFSYNKNKPFEVEAHIALVTSEDEYDRKTVTLNLSRRKIIDAVKAQKHIIEGRKMEQFLQIDMEEFSTELINCVSDVYPHTKIGIMGEEFKKMKAPQPLYFYSAIPETNQSIMFAIPYQNMELYVDEWEKIVPIGKEGEILADSLDDQLRALLETS